MADEVLREVEQFLYREARLLDERRFHEWLDLFTDDVRYWMTGRSNRYPASSKAITATGPDGPGATGPFEEESLAILDETKVTLRGRVARLDTGMAWAEDPPSRTRHIITNIEVTPGDAASEVTVYSNFMVYRNRTETEQDFYVGARQDVLRRVDRSWKIARRKLILDQNVLLAKNVSVFARITSRQAWSWQMDRRPKGDGERHAYEDGGCDGRAPGHVELASSEEGCARRRCYPRGRIECTEGAHREP